MPQLIHWLSESPALVTASAVVCGDPTAAVATWDAARVTCPQCLRRCTCGPTVPVCPACSAFNAAHHGGPTRLPPLRTEKAFQEAVRQLALSQGFLYYHTQDARKSPAGFVDTVLLRGPVLICAELKSETGRLSAAQEVWGQALAHVQQVQYYLWRPRDFAHIEEVLR